jgi:hypothetical protein
MCDDNRCPHAVRFDRSNDLNRRLAAEEVEVMSRSSARSFLPRLFGVLAAGLVVSALVATPAGASASRTHKNYLAGWSAAVDVTTVDATVTLPSFTCTSKKDNITADTNVYDTTAAQFSGPYVYLGCSKHGMTLTPHYTAAISVDGVGSNPAVTMNAGDAVVFSISCGGTGTSVSIDDLTTSSSGSASSSNASACSGPFVGDIGVCARCGTHPKQDPLPTFGAIDYSNVTVNGSPLASTGPTSQNYFEGNENTIATGALTGGGTAFTTTEGTA